MSLLYCFALIFVRFESKLLPSTWCMIHSCPPLHSAESRARRTLKGQCDSFAALAVVEWAGLVTRSRKGLFVTVICWPGNGPKGRHCME